MRIFITGSNGFVAQKFCEISKLGLPSHAILGVSKSSNRNPNLADSDFLQLDLADFEALSAALQQFAPTHILHTAAITSVEACKQDKSLADLMNVQLTSFLAYYCKNKSAHLTFLSTDFVFDGKEGPYIESAPTNPVNAYGQTKVEAEQRIIQSEADAAILRTILVYGVIADPNRSNLVLWAKKQLENNQTIRVVSDQWRMPTWVDDLAKACLLAMQKNAVGIYHISSTAMYSILELVEQVAQHWNLDRSLITPISADEIGQATNRPRATGFILDKAKRELGFSPTSFADSLLIIDKQLKSQYN